MPFDEEGGNMAKVVNCECGYTARGETDDELVADVEAHVQRDHPEMAGKMTREDVLAMAEED
jgi:predicted small metal-binding protein